MKILYHHRTRAEDAQGIHIASIVNAFRSLGHEVDVVAIVDPEKTGADSARPGFLDRLSRRVPGVLQEVMQLGYNAYGYRLLLRALRAKRYDLIYERYSLNTLCGIWASRRAGVPIVVEVNAPLSVEEKDLGRLRLGFIARRTERWICSRATRTLAVTDVLRSILVQEGVPPERIAVMPNGIDPDVFNPNVSGADVRKRHGIEGKTTIGFIGWFRAWHGLEMLIESFRDADLGARNARLLLIGDGPAAPDLRRIVRERGLEGQVVFTGPVDRADVPRHIAALDVAVQPHATAYASPMKLFEYMGMERCIVAPDQPNIREILTDGTDAALFTSKDPAHLARVLAGLCGDADRRRALGRAARRTLLARGYLWKKNAERTLGLVLGASRMA